MDEEASEAELLAVFDHYNLPEPRYGEHPMKCPVHGDKVGVGLSKQGEGAVALPRLRGRRKRCKPRHGPRKSGVPRGQSLG